jgi:hypothetical protein
MKKLLFTAALAFGCTATLFAQVPNYVPTNGLVGWWPFNGNANDESGNGNNGTVNGATLTMDRCEISNSAFSFDGNSSRIVVADNNTLDIQSNQSLSIATWVKHDLSVSNIGVYIISKYSGIIATGPQYGIGTGFTGQGYTTTQIASGLSNHIELRGNNVINDGEWHHLTYLWENGSNVKLYVDGILDTAKNMTLSGSIINNLNLHFGCGANLAQFYKGKIDDIGIWNRILTENEIQNLYNAQLGTNSTTNISACDSYTWNGNTYTQSGQYSFLTSNANGCDSTANLNLTINNTSSSTQTQSALDSYTWPVNGQTYTQSGTYTATISNAAGCDSIITLNLSLSYTGIDELSPNHGKTLVKITDLNGKETPFKKNTALLFIYEDGTVERVYVAE